MLRDHAANYRKTGPTICVVLLLSCTEYVDEIVICGNTNARQGTNLTGEATPSSLESGDAITSLPRDELSL